jgi:hypothetical protein
MMQQLTQDRALVMGILALIAEFENDIRRERQMDGIKKARERGIRFGRKPLLVSETIQQVRKLRKSGKTVPEIMRQTCLSKASVYRALAGKWTRVNQGLGCDGSPSTGRRAAQLVCIGKPGDVLATRRCRKGKPFHSLLLGL